jgi:hypothetical protein
MQNNERPSCVPSLLETADDVADKSTLYCCQSKLNEDWHGRRDVLPGHRQA